jgi:anti-sigma factor RsiW
MTPEMLQAEAELQAEEDALKAALAAEAAAEVPARPEKPLWTMEIYEGDNVSLEQVPLDADLSK